MRKYQPSPPLMMSNLFNARSFDKISGFIQRAKADADVKILVGGKCDNSSGYFISPTILETSNPRSETMVQEIFGPVLTVSTGTALAPSPHHPPSPPCLCTLVALRT